MDTSTLPRPTGPTTSREATALPTDRIRRSGLGPRPPRPPLARPGRRPEPGPGRPCSACCSPPASSTSGGSARAAGPTPSTPRPCRPAPSRGRRSSSAPATPRARSPSTRRRSSLWPMALSVRLFGLSSWSILVPQALMGVATVGLLHRLVRRTTGSRGRRPDRRRRDGADPGRRADVPLQQPRRAAHPADGRRRRRHPARRSTPAASRGRPPGPLAVPRRRPRRARLPDQDAAGVPGAAGAGARLPAVRPDLVGQAPRPPARRVRLDAARRRLVDRDRRAVAGVEPPLHRRLAGPTRSSSSPSATTASAGSAATRPARSAAAARAAPATGARPGSSGCSTARSAARSRGCSRRHSSSARPRSGSRRRQNRLRAGLTLWLTWLLVTALTFSFMAGIFHAYYTVALAPAVAALVGIGAWVLWQHRSSYVATGVLVLHHGAHLGVRVVPPRPRRRLRPLAEVGRRGRRPGRPHSPSPGSPTCPAGSPSPWRPPPWWPRSPARRRTP